MIATPSSTGSICTPRYACRTSPVEMSCRAIEPTVFEGIANPTPSEPPDSLSIWAFTPITRPSAVEQRASGVAVVDRRIRLDRVRDREVVRRRHLTVKRADDAARDRPLEAERATHREDRVSDADRTRVGDAKRREQALRRIDPDHGEVGRRIGADELRRRARRRSRSSPRSTKRPATTCWFVTMWPGCRTRSRIPARSTVIRRSRRSRRRTSTRWS